MSFKKFTGKVHLWLGLASGLVVFILAVTGCIYCFQEEIQHITQSEYRYVKPQSLPMLQPSKLAEIAAENLPGKTLHSVQYGKKEDAIVASFYSNAGGGYYYLMYMNPYDGTVLKTKDMSTD